MKRNHWSVQTVPAGDWLRPLLLRDRASVCPVRNAVESNNRFHAQLHACTTSQAGKEPAVPPAELLRSRPLGLGAGDLLRRGIRAGR